MTERQNIGLRKSDYGKSKYCLPPRSAKAMPAKDTGRKITFIQAFIFHQ